MFGVKLDFTSLNIRQKGFDSQFLPRFMLNFLNSGMRGIPQSLQPFLKVVSKKFLGCLSLSSNNVRLIFQNLLNTDVKKLVWMNPFNIGFNDVNNACALVPCNHFNCGKIPALFSHCQVYTNSKMIVIMGECPVGVLFVPRSEEHTSELQSREK